MIKRVFVSCIRFSHSMMMRDERNSQRPSRISGSVHHDANSEEGVWSDRGMRVGRLVGF